MALPKFESKKYWPSPTKQEAGNIEAKTTQSEFKTKYNFIYARNCVSSIGISPSISCTFYQNLVADRVKWGWRAFPFQSFAFKSINKPALVWYQERFLVHCVEQWLLLITANHDKLFSVGHYWLTVFQKEKFSSRVLFSFVGGLVFCLQNALPIGLPG